MGISERADAQSRSLGRLNRLVVFSARLVWAAARRSFIGLNALQLVGAALLALQVLAVQAVLNGILSITESGVAGVLMPVVVLALLTAASAVAGSVQSSLTRFIGESVARQMWQRVIAVSTGVGLRRFEDPEFFDRLERVRTNALVRPFQVTSGVISSVGATVASIGLAATLVAFNPLLLPLLLVSGIPVILTSRRESRREFRFTVAQTARMRERTYLSILMTGRDEAKEVRAYGLARTLRERFDGLYGAYLSDLARHLRRRAGLSLLGQLTAALVLGATLIVLVWLIATGGLSVASAGAALVAVRLLSSQLQTFAGGIQTIFESGLFIDDLQDFVELAPKTALPASPKPQPLERVEARGVRFTYPGADAPAVAGVDLHIGRGEVVALVGENGSGKSTLAKVVSGLYPVDAGELMWNGRAYRDLPAGTVEASTAVIFQDFVRYALDAATNISFGNPDAEPDARRIRHAAEASGAHAFLSALPQGYETILTRLFQDGTDLSGGQWQRVAIARAFYRNASLVVLDEPSAALDPRAEYDLFSSLRRTLEGRAALVISHRFSTVRNADRIYVMAAGRVAEEGTHDELMARDGMYAELFRLQAAAYLPDRGPSASD